MRLPRTSSLVLAALLVPVVVSSQSLRSARSVWASAAAEVPAIAQEVETMLRAGRLAAARTQRDGQIPGRSHERLNQYHQGVRVFGGQLVWQKEGGRILSVTGNLYDGIDVETRPSLTADDAARRALEGSASARVVGRIELVVLPLAERYVLAYYLHLRGRDSLDAIFIDAGSGAAVLKYDDRRTRNPWSGSASGPGPTRRR